MTPDQARKSMERAYKRLNRDNRATLDRFEKTAHRVRAACTHEWRKNVEPYERTKEWECAACGLVSKKKPKEAQ